MKLVKSQRSQCFELTPLSVRVIRGLNGPGDHLSVKDLVANITKRKQIWNTMDAICHFLLSCDEDRAKYGLSCGPDRDPFIDVGKVHVFFSHCTVLNTEWSKFERTQWPAVLSTLDQGPCDEKTQSTSAVIYTDGGADDNGSAGCRAGAGIYFGPDDPRNASIPVPGEQTNNRGELTAILYALLNSQGNVTIRTDSQYSIHVITGKYKANVNLDLLQAIWQIKWNRERANDIIEMEWVKAHHIDEGNKEADRLASQAKRGRFTNETGVNDHVLRESC